MTAATLGDDTIRAWWAHRQGLDGSLAGAPADRVLERTGWSRSVGGAGPYLTLFSRAGIRRAEADAAAATPRLGGIHELPSARGCTYVVPWMDYGLALRVGQDDGDPAEVALAKKQFGVTEDELARLHAGVLAALAAGPLDPAALKAALGDTVRNLGPEARKRGLTTTLPLALGALQSTGAIIRVPLNGRLDQQRFRYARWGLDAPALRLPQDEALGELARRYWRWAGPASLAQFQWFTGLSGKAARPIVAPLGLVPLANGDPRLMFPEDRDALLAFRAPTEPFFALVGWLDNIAHLRRDVAGLLAPEDRERQVYAEKEEQPVANLSDLPSHAILDRGRLVGLWEYDPDAGAIAWRTFTPQPGALKEAIARTEAYIREDLGDMRGFSLDSPESRRPRIAALRRDA
ncbi:MAG TPA: crosslink repair DNA glycosylase YcaQ family protein [Ktedonobacterales bacterium]|nr:crosslink repair DNA glycosylase YcaQ family protein [Ktedonobacterales bacterium]